VTSPLFVDVYASDLNGHLNWQALAKLGPPWHGAIIKATEGVTYEPSWFGRQWRAIREAVPDRFGGDFFRGAYHFLRFGVSGKAQAEYYVRAIERAGGWAIGDLWPIVDVELGSDAHPNRRATASQVVDSTRTFAARVQELSGRKVMLYGNGAMRDLGIRDRMGCSWMWCPRYTPTLPREIYERAGWTLDELVLWQYCGDGTAFLSGYPATVPGFGSCDLSVLVHGGGIEWLRSQLWAEFPAT
jgi:GH25 family lysozyme M1 (1,4-beta-N-acetylmuramidase)